MEPAKLFSDLPTIETPRLLLRKVTLEDAQDAFEYAKDPKVSRYLPWEAHQSVEDSRAFIRTVLDGYSKGASGAWAIHYKPAGKMVGTFAYHNWLPAFRRAAVGYAIGRDYWNHGLMTEALGRMLRFGFEALDLNRIEATCDDLNVGSWRVMEKCGMKQEGSFRQHMFFKGRYRDNRLYAILKEDWTRGK